MGIGTRVIQRWAALAMIAMWITGHAAGAEQPKPASVRESDGSAKSSDLQSLLRPFTTATIDRRFGDTVRPVKLILTGYKEEKPNTLNGDFPTSFGCEVSADGMIHYFHRSSSSIKGSGYPKLGVAEAQRLNGLLEKLPPSSASLPELNRRLIVQVANDGKYDARVYDRADLPNGILELVRITGTKIRPWMPSLKPSTEVEVDRHDDNAVALSPDGQTIVWAASHGDLKFFSSDTGKLLDERKNIFRNIPVTALTFSPDGKVAIVQGWGELVAFETNSWRQLAKLEELWEGRRRHLLIHPVFLSDGSQLLALTTKPTMKAFDTTTWEPAKKLSIPARLKLAFVPALRSPVAVVAPKRWSVALWDSQRNIEIATLDENARLHQVVFSPDESLVAIATTHQGRGDYWNEYRIRVWKTQTGEFVREFLPQERAHCEAVEGMLWSHDGKYLLAAAKPDHFWTSRDVCIWNVASGRQRTALTGASTEITGLALTRNHEKLAVGCKDGMLRFWDYRATMKAVDEFETSLTNSKP